MKVRRELKRARSGSAGIWSRSGELKVEGICKVDGYVGVGNY